MTHSPPEFDIQDVSVEQRTSEYRGFFAIDKFTLRHKLYAGGFSDSFDRELFMRAPAAGVLLYDPKLDSVVLVEQFRIGALLEAQEKGSSPWCLEVVAGILAPNETAAELSRREAMEEAGCEIHALEPICEYYNSPGGSNERINLYCGQVNASNAGGIYGLADENEDIRALVLSFDEAWLALQAGRMNNAMAIIAMQWLFINRNELKERWLKDGNLAG